MSALQTFVLYLIKLESYHGGYEMRRNGIETVFRYGQLLMDKQITTTLEIMQYICCTRLYCLIEYFNNKVDIGMYQENHQDNKLSSIHILFCKTERCILMERDSDEFDNDTEFIFNFTIANDDEIEHLSIPVFNFIFFLSMGRFQ